MIRDEGGQPDTSGATRPLRIQLCGGLVVERNGQRIEGQIRGRQGRLLFSYLVLNRNRSMPRDELLEAVWPAAPRTRAADLSTLLSRLRKLLGRELLQGRDELRLLLPPGSWVDVDAAEEALSRADAAIAREDVRAAWGPAHAAVSISDRELLPGLEGFWLEQRRRALFDLRLEALEALARLGLQLGGSELAAAERAARRLIELAPLRESGHMSLMEVQVARGNPAEALGTFDELRRGLRDQLGVSPGSQARALHAQLVASSSEEDTTTPAPARPDGTDAVVPLPRALAGLGAVAFVGRQRELERLKLMLERARELPRQLALVAGEPGIGKTRLLAQFSGWAADRFGARVLYGRADEDGLVPYGPFLGALRSYVTEAAPESLRPAAELGGPELAMLLPELAARAGIEAAGEGEADPAFARLRLFDAVSRLLAEAARERPLVLALDDLHWADESTLLLLKHVLRAPEQRSLLALVAYRGAALVQGGPLADVIATLQRELPIDRIHVRGLAGADVVALAMGVAEGELEPATLRTIQSETEGNPFFVLELTRHLAASRPDGPSGRRAVSGAAEPASLVPESVRDVIRQRVGALSEPAQRTLTVAAVAGREFEIETVAAVADEATETLIDPLEEATGAGIVAEVPGSPGSFIFAHALIRTVLYASITAARRVQLHARAAAVAEAREPPRNAEIAHHWLSALPHGDADRAIDFAQRAAAESAAMLAFGEAVDHLTRALTALERHRPAARERRLELLLDLADAQRYAGRMPEARLTGTEAATVARDAGDARALARAAIAYGGTGFESAFVDETLVALLEEALAALDRDDDALRTEILSRLATAILYVPGPESERRRATLSAEAVAMAERLADPRAMLAALEGRHYALARPEDLDERLATARRIVDLAAQAGDIPRGLLGRYFLIADVVEEGDTATADEAIAEYGQRAAETRLPLHRWYHARFLAMRALLAGRLEDARAQIQEAGELGSAVEPRTAMMHLGTQAWVLHRELGTLAELEEGARAFAAQYAAIPAWRLGLAWTLLEQGRREEAMEIFEPFAAARFRNIPVDSIWTMTVALAAELSVGGLGDDRAVSAIEELMTPHKTRNCVTGEAVVNYGPMSLYLGMTALARGDRATAVSRLEHAVAAAERMRAGPCLVRAQLLLAKALRDGGDPAAEARSTALAADAERLRAELGCAPPLLGEGALIAG
jgi:DNA-binding SARP family transcriptional activator/tetratricopeptide (TPR) repeat protein